MTNASFEVNYEMKCARQPSDLRFFKRIYGISPDLQKVTWDAMHLLCRRCHCLEKDAEACQWLGTLSERTVLSPEAKWGMAPQSLLQVLEPPAPCISAVHVFLQCLV